jgi:hypothetical protein
MNEAAARQVLLARAYDSTAPSPNWNGDDQAWARHATVRRVGEQASVESFVVQRAGIVTERLAVRDRSIPRLLRALEWRRWLGWAVAALAFFAGIGTDALSAGSKVNILAPPLLATLAWNLGVFALLAARRAGLLPGRVATLGGRLSSMLARLAGGARAARDGGPPARRFLRDWTAASAGLHAARAARVLHLAAAAFALGLLAGLYLRGLAFEYRAGWESTFLDAAAVRALLGAVLGPASAVTGIALPDAAQLAAIRFPAAAGENAARWIHLHAATIGMFVVLPRLLMAAVAGWRAHRLAADFPLRLDGAYFRGLVQQVRGEPARVQVVPYSYAVPMASIRGLHALLGAALATEVGIDVAPAVTADDVDRQDASPIVAPLDLALALFNMSATPELQTHADFVATLRAHLPGDAPLFAVVDETSFRTRFSHEPRRLDERRAAWRAALADTGTGPVFAALGGADPAEAADELRQCIERAAADRSAGTRARPAAG